MDENEILQRLAALDIATLDAWLRAHGWLHVDTSTVGADAGPLAGEFRVYEAATGEMTSFPEPRDTAERAYAFASAVSYAATVSAPAAARAGALVAVLGELAV